MKRVVLFPGAVWLLLAVFALMPSALADKIIRIGDAAGGTPMQAVRFAALRYNMQHRSDLEITINAFPAAAALQALESGKLDMLFIESSAIPSTYRGKRQLYAAEALVFYVSEDNPVRQLTSTQLREIWAGGQPVWSWFGGTSLDIQRMGVKLSAENNLENHFLGEARFNKGIFRVHSAAQALLLINPASLLAAPYCVNYPMSTEVLAVDGVKPDSRNIASGRYPFARRYELLTGRNLKPYAAGLVKFMHSGAVYRELKESGLLFLGQIGGDAHHEKRP